MKQIFAITLCILLATGCARGGFESQAPIKSSEIPVLESKVDEPAPLTREIFTVTMEQYTEQLNILYSEIYSTLPNDEAVSAINAAMAKVVAEVSDYFDLSDNMSKVTLNGEVTYNDSIFSQHFAGTFSHPDLSEPTQFAFGLSFDLETGKQLTVEQFFAADVLSGILYNEEENMLLQTDKERYERARTEVNQMGQTMLEHRILAANLQQSLDHLNTFSYYLTRDSFIAIIPMSAEAGYVGYFEIPR